MRHYIIDGNNLIGKLKQFGQIKAGPKNSDRERLAYIIDRFFKGKKVKVSLHFDGHPGDAIKSETSRIIYSYNEPADTGIRNEITASKSRSRIYLVTSDFNLAQFGEVNSCHLITSEEFSKQIKQLDSKDEETEKIKQLSRSNERFKELFEGKNPEK